MDKVNIHAGHRARLRQQMQNSDISKMPEHMILEYMLSFAQPYKDVNPTAHALIEKFGSLSAVLDADMEELKTVTGISEVTAHYLKFCGVLPKVIALSRSKQNINRVSNPNSAIKFLEEHVPLTSKEEFYYMTMDTRYNMLKFDLLGYGSAYEAHVDIRELVRKLSEPTTYGVIICHTHPHGDSKPSKNDISFTKTLLIALNTLGIELCDHVIIGTDGHYSFFNSGVLQKLK